ncbi:hypothetical protein J2X63_003196 [Agromyces sp. 3263]|uniref:hypothetical protein n=1 Tax=Agromyces sp. 3263 TaxID=2817750 RepID=UPI002864A811|nr:hypothetical protein [Agromyces sp. 3263]MDR6907488.1 hypothetical protein [Agromyces sp. 3263]
MSQRSPLLDNPDFMVDLKDLALSGGEVSRKWGIAKSAVNKYRSRLTTGAPLLERSTSTVSSGESETHNHDGSASYVRFSETAWGFEDYCDFIRSKGQNPDEVSFTWGWTSNPLGGFWNKLNNVRPKSASDAVGSVDWVAASKFVEGFTYVPAKREFLVDSAVLQPTDEQWGKTDFDGGTPETEARVLNSYARFADYIREYRPRQVLLARTGDGIENTCSTNSQRDTNDLDVPHMLVQSFKMDLQSLKIIAPLVGEVVDARVTSNHGRWRTGLKADAGNPHADFGIAVGRQLEDTQRILDVLPNVRFEFPQALMESMTVKLDTVSVGMVHGHQSSGADRMGEWWSKQDHGRMPTWDADYLLVGHWHSYRKYQSGDKRWVIVGPASDPGSSWFSNLKGERSSSGMNAFVFEGKRVRFEEIL